MFDEYITTTGRLSTKQPQEIKDQWYIRKAKEVHGDKYDYSQFKYITSTTKVDIMCRDHGVFHQTPDSHIRGRGCPECSGKLKKNTQSVITDFTQVHGDKYNYSSVKYNNNHTKVSIICSKHGVFKQRPYDHLAGHGCPKCQNHNQTILYLLRCRNTDLVKIGITSNIGTRLGNIGGDLYVIYSKKVPDPRSLEQKLHNMYQVHRVFNNTVNNGGTEFFNLSDTQVQEIEEIINNVGTITT